MVWVHTHTVALEVKGVLAELDIAQLILVQVRPSPNPGVDHVRKAFSPGNLHTTGILAHSHNTHSARQPGAMAHDATLILSSSHY